MPKQDKAHLCVAEKISQIVLPLQAWQSLLDANYFYLMAKPINPSVLDYFGPWPIYILVAELLVIGFFAIAMLPVILIKATAKTPTN